MKSQPALLTPKFAISCLLLVSALAGCQAGKRGGSLEGRATDEWTRSYPLAAGGEVQIVGGKGSVDVQGGAGSTVELRAERVALAASDASARELLPRIKIREDVTPEKIVIQTEGLGGIVIGVEIQVNYHVTIPAGASVRVRTADGRVTVADVDGGSVLSSANGEIVGKNLRGRVEARAVNQSASIDLAGFGNDPVEVRSVNGQVDLTLPADANATVDATSVNGTIDMSEMKFETYGEPNRRRTRGRFNSGGAPITLNAVNGNIRVHPRP
jgi:Putative adhesin